MTLANFREITKGLDGKKVDLAIQTHNSEDIVEEHPVEITVHTTYHRDYGKEELQKIIRIIIPVDIDC